MTIEEEIETLLRQAEPLRCLPDDEPAKVPLTAIVDEINALRAMQADEAVGRSPARIEGDDVDPDAPIIEYDPMTDPLPRRRPGRPRKNDL